MNLHIALRVSTLGLLSCLATAGTCSSTSAQQPRSVAAGAPALAAASASWTRAQKVFDSRCIVCHGCFDAPCQLKLDSFEGISRGANPTRVYTARPLAIEPTRLFVDAHDTAAWRRRGFHPVVPDDKRQQAEQSVLLRMLALKRDHPFSTDTDVANTFTLALDRKESCAKEPEFDTFAREHPMWGMPYALPALSDDENAVLVTWVKAGMPHAPLAPVAKSLQASIQTWETFFNDDSLRGRLVARYLFEHLYFASLYFADDPSAFFVLVRSRTPPGRPVDEIATRRPFDDPDVDRVYYRLVHRERQPLDKTHVPYALGVGRLARLKELFFNSSVVVTSLPGYEPAVAANPFKVFRALPVASRYRFMLDDAQYTMMGFIKGSACRGNVALNVINDRFWVAFVDPSSPWITQQDSFLADNVELLDLPAEGGSNAPLLQWMHYGEHRKEFLKQRGAYLSRVDAKSGGVTPAVLWDGDGTNANAALTVFRHYDHGSAVAGFVGDFPSTAYVVDYELMERITYLIVDGFDLFGGISHQLQTRMYMDYLRIEGEANFLALLPSARRKELVDLWYRGLPAPRKRAIDDIFAIARGEPKIAYASKTPERELFALLQTRLDAARSHRFDAASAATPALRDALEGLGRVRGVPASLMPELSFVRAGDQWLTITRDSAHANVAQMFDEDKRRIVSEDALTAVPGFLGAYPDAFFDVPNDELPVFVSAVAKLGDVAAYAALRHRYGVMRNSPRFWAFSDDANAAAHALDPIGSGTFDYSRLDPL